MGCGKLWSVAGGVVVKTSCWVLKEQPRTPVCGVPPVWGVVVFSGRYHLVTKPCVADSLGGGWLGRGGGCGVVGGVLFENCTVDASIFVVKLLRAYGGCLGTRSR